jgi:HK97 family phage portal protein
LVGLFEKIFGNRREITTQQLKLMSGYTPVFTQFGGNAYNSDVVRSAIHTIASNAAKLTPKHIRKKEKGIEDANSRLGYLLQTRPNPYMNAYDFIYKVISQRESYNNAYIYIDYDERGMVRALYPISAASVEFVEVPGQPGVFCKFRFWGGTTITLPYEEIIHLRKFFNDSDIYGEPNDRALLPTLELIHATNQGIVNAIKSSAFLRGLLIFTGMLKEEDMEKQRKKFVDNYMGLSNEGGIAATDAKAEYKELKSEPKMVNGPQMAIIEEKVFKYFGVNKSIVMSDYNEDQWNAFYENVIEPIAIQMSLEITGKIFTTQEQSHGNRIVFEANRLQYASATTKIALGKELMPLGLFTVNEMREIFNLAPVEDGDKRLQTLNVVSADKADNYQVGKGDDANDQQGQRVSELPT